MDIIKELWQGYCKYWSDLTNEFDWNELGHGLGVFTVVACWFIALVMAIKIGIDLVSFIYGFLF